LCTSKVNIAVQTEASGLRHSLTDGDNVGKPNCRAGIVGAFALPSPMAGPVDFSGKQLLSKQKSVRKSDNQMENHLSLPADGSVGN